MSEKDDIRKKYKSDFHEEMEKKATRKLKGKNKKKYNVWFGLGMMGIVGWSVAVPSLIGVAIGLWLDVKYPGRPMWTLIMLSAGVIAGSLNAWYWVQKERKEEDEE